MAAAFLLFASLALAVDFTYWIEPRAGGDAELAEWALKAWENKSDGSLRMVRSPSREAAQLRVIWVNGRDGLYGEARPIVVNGKRGAELHIRPAMDGLGAEIEAAARKDPLLRDAIVYLTCLHESGHGLGFSHTAGFADIMYSFGYGGDIGEYFGRYRRKLSVRNDIKKQSGISAADEQNVQHVFGNAERH